MSLPSAQFWRTPPNVRRRYAESGAGQIHYRIAVPEQTARTLGRGPLRAWAETTFRLTLPGIAAGGLLVLLTAMKELPATLMLRPTGLDTLATELWSRTEIAAYGAAAPYAIALVALAAVPAWLLSRAMTRTDVDTVDS